MKTRKNRTNTRYLTVNGYVHEKFKYLGVLVTSINNMQVEIHQGLITVSVIMV